MSGDSPTTELQTELPDMQAEPAIPSGKSTEQKKGFRGMLGQIRSALTKKPEDGLRSLASQPTVDRITEMRNLFDYNTRETAPTRQEVIGFLRRFPMLYSRKTEVSNRSELRGQFEVATQELVNGLTDYFLNRASDLKKTSDNPLRIVEVGAGSGVLAYYIVKELERRGLSELITYVATDKGYVSSTSDSLVKGNTDYSEALDVYKPDIVLASWPAPTRDGISGEDWTPAFRAKGVGEYMLIGDPTACGDLLNTWGIITRYNANGHFVNREATEEARRQYAQGILPEDQLPLFDTDGRGYHRVDVPSLDQIPLLGANDNYTSDEPSASRIVVFRRQS